MSLAQLGASRFTWNYYAENDQAGVTAKKKKIVVCPCSRHQNQKLYSDVQTRRLYIGVQLFF